MQSFLSSFIRVFIILFILCALFIVFLPSIVSTDWGRKQTVDWINRSIPGKIEIQHINVGWLKGQKLDGVILKDSEGTSILKIEHLSTEATLWRLIHRDPCLGLTQANNLHATIVTNEKGTTNLQEALGIRSDETHLPLIASKIMLSNVNIKTDLFAPNRPLSAQITGLTEQGNLKGSFDIHFSLKGFWACDWLELKQDIEKYLTIEGSKEAKIKASIVNFPVDLIDRLAALRNPNLNGVFHSLLGDRLNIHLDKEPSEEGLAFNLTLLTPLMQGDMKGIIKGDIFSLQEPSVFHLDLVPSSINPLIKSKGELLGTSRLELIFSDLFFPLSFFNQKETNSPCLFGLNAEFKIPKTAILIDSIGPIEISNLQAHATSPLCDSFIQIELKGEAKQGENPFDLHFKSSIHKPKNFSELNQEIQQSMRSDLTISNLPLQLLPFFHQQPQFSEKIGTYANLQLTLYPNPKNKKEWGATFSFQTPHLALKETKWMIGEKISLLFPAQLSWNFSPDCLSSLLKAEEWVLDQPYSLQCILKEFELPLENPELAKFELESSIPQLLFPKLSTLGIVKFQNSSLTMKGKNLKELTSDFQSRFSLLNLEGGDPSPFIPEPLIVQQTSNWKVGEDGAIEMLTGALKIQNSVTDVQFEGLLRENGIFKFTQPFKAEYLLSPTAFKALNRLANQESLPIQEDISFTLSIDPTEFNLKAFSLPKLHVQGLLKIGKIAIQNPSRSLPVLEDVMIPWVIDFPNHQIQAGLKGLAYTQKDSKPSHLSGSAKFWLTPGYYDARHTQAEIQMNIPNLPTSIFNFLGTPDLSPVIGSISDISFKAFFDPTKGKPGYLDMILDSTHFHLGGRFNLDEYATIFDFNKLPAFHLTITPESYEYLKKAFSFQDERQLTAPVTLTGILSQFNFPMDELSFGQGAFHFQFSTTDIVWKKASTAPYQLKANISTEKIAEHIDFSINMQGSTLLSLQGSLGNLLDKKNRLQNWQNMHLKAKLNGQHLTPAFIEGGWPLNADQKQKLEAFFGETLDIKAAFQLQQNLNGSIQALVKGNQGSIQLEGQVKSGVLTLNQPLECFANMTPLFTQTFLIPKAPLFHSFIKAEHPILLTIDPSQFSCPLIPFQLEKIKIGKGKLDLGKLHFRNEGELKSILSIVRPLSESSLIIWPTPLYFELNQGILDLKRFDVLVAHAYTLSNWGFFNLMTNQADFILGLNGQTLEYAFGIQGLNNEEILQIPLKIRSGKMEIDKKKATAKIGSLIAQTHGGLKGSLLGNILNIAVSNKDEPYPSATTQPFPWHEEFNTFSKETSTQSDFSKPEGQSKQEGKKKKKKGKILETTSIQDIPGEALELLDHWFKK